MTTPAPLSTRTRHCAIDMQRLFAEDTEWHTPDLAGILPNVVALCEGRRARTLFARFHPPSRAEAARGRWRTYYERWRSVTGERLDPALLDLVAPLAALAGPMSLVDKETYSVFGAPGFAARLIAEGVDTLVFSGVETDVCVLASVLDAVDAGLRVVVARDAVASSSRAAHEAVLDHLLPRLAEQVELCDTGTILRNWDA